MRTRLPRTAMVLALVGWLAAPGHLDGPLAVGQVTVQAGGPPARTLAGAAQALRHAGARNVHAVFTHAVMAPGAADRLRTAGFGRVATTDSIPLPEASWLQTVSMAPLFEAGTSVQPEAGDGAAAANGAFPANPAGWSNWRPKDAVKFGLSSGAM